MEDRPGGGVDVVAAAGAGPRLPPLGCLVPLERPFLLALRAVGVLAILGSSAYATGVQAGGIVGELLHELHEA